MTNFTNLKQNNSKTSNKRQQAAVANYSVPEVIEAITPLFLATVGAIIGFTVIVADISETKATAGLGLAGTAIAGAAGLARTGSTSEQDFSVKQQDGNLEIETPATHEGN